MSNLRDDFVLNAYGGLTDSLEDDAHAGESLLDDFFQVLLASV